MADRGKSQERQYRTKYFGLPLERILADEDPDTALVRGFFTSDQRDEAGDIITRTATERAIVKYRRWGNVRYMHLPKPVGKITRIGDEDGLAWNEVEIQVIDPQAVFEVRKGLLNALSVGIYIDFENLEFLEDGGLLISDYTLCEVSLVDHPANYDAFLTSIKGAIHEYERLPLDVQAQLQKEGVNMAKETLKPMSRGGGYERVSIEEEEEVELAAAVDQVEEDETVEKGLQDELEEIETAGLAETEPDIPLDLETAVPETEEPVTETKSPACRQDGESVDDCVERKIPELIDEGMDQEQAVAAAHSICEEPCKSCPNDEEKAEVVEVEAAVVQPDEVESEMLETVEEVEPEVVEKVQDEQETDISEVTLETLQAEIEQLRQDFAVATGMLKVVAEALHREDEQSNDEDEPEVDVKSLSERLDALQAENAELKEAIQKLQTPVERRGMVRETELPETFESDEEPKEQSERTLKSAVRRHLERRYEAQKR